MSTIYLQPTGEYRIHKYFDSTNRVMDIKLERLVFDSRDQSKRWVEVQPLITKMEPLVKTKGSKNNNYRKKSERRS